MTKVQLLILLLIIALVFYCWSEEPKTPPLIKKPIKPQPKPTINPPATKIEELLNQGWPSHFPPSQWVEEPKPDWELPKIKGLNPPHSQLDEPKATLNCPATEFISDTTQAPEPTSELTTEEKSQRLRQELADYNWLLNNKTIADWQQEQKLTATQYQVLRTLVSEEEMNTLEHFLNLLPVNYEWLLLSSEFKTQPVLIEQWKQHFTYNQTQDWLKIGLPPTDYALAAWLKNVKNLTPEEVLNTQDFDKLKIEFNHYAKFNK